MRLPEPGEGPLDYLLPEARWQELLGLAPDPAAWLMALSQATGVYFFPSREWPPRFLRFLQVAEDHPPPGGRRRPGLPHRGPGPAL